MADENWQIVLLIFAKLPSWFICRWVRRHRIRSASASSRRFWQSASQCAESDV